MPFRHRYTGSKPRGFCWLALLQVLLANATVRDGLSDTSAPNVLIAIADDWSYGHASALGCSWVNTPAYDRVAFTGTSFTRCYTPNAKCAPSRACLLTGRNPWQLKAACNHVAVFPAEFRTFIEALELSGYRVGYTGKGWGPGVAKHKDGSERLLTGVAYKRVRHNPPSTGIHPNDYAANFADFLDQQEGGPWCFWYGSMEPHRGYEFGAGERISGKSVDQIDRVPAYWPDTDVVRTDMLDYAHEVEHFDMHLGRMLNELDRRGVAGSTLVIVTSDHGMPFPRVKGQAYEPSNHVPLAIRWPGASQQAGTVCSELVSLIDIAPTVLRVAGVPENATGMTPMTGLSLADNDGEPDFGPLMKRDAILIGKERHDVGRPTDAGYPIRGCVTREWLYLRNYETDRWPAGNPETGYLNCDGSPTKTLLLDQYGSRLGRIRWESCFGKRRSEELYYLEDDPDCLTNLASNEQYLATRQRMGRRLAELLTAEGDPRASGKGDLFETYPYADPRTRNYHSRFVGGEHIEAGWVNESDYRPEHNPSYTGKRE